MKLQVKSPCAFHEGIWGVVSTAALICRIGSQMDLICPLCPKEKCPYLSREELGMQALLITTDLCMELSERQVLAVHMC
jgi:hypothetical protein